MTEICSRAGISQATYFNGKKKYDGLLPMEMKRLEQLRDEDGKLRKLVADLSLDEEMLPAWVSGLPRWTVWVDVLRGEASRLANSAR